MADNLPKIGTRVEIVGKDVKGKIAFVGNTNFSAGKWFGVILDEPKGKNNGCVQGKIYFICPDNYGMFVRQTQLIILDAENEIKSKESLLPRQGFVETISSAKDNEKRRKSSVNTGIPKFSNNYGRLQEKTFSSSGNSSLFSRQTHLLVPNDNDKVLKRRKSISPSPYFAEKFSFEENEKRRRSLGSTNIQKLHSAAGTNCTKSMAETLSKTSITDSIKTSLLKDNISNNFSNTGNIGASTNLLTQKDQEIENLKKEIKDLNEKLETLKIKRAEDQHKIKEATKTRIQIQQLLEFKTKFSEVQANLQRELTQAKREAKEAIEAKDQHAEDMSDLAEAMEMATLDKEMAEEKCETLQAELDQTKEKLEELQIDYEILKTEMTEKRSDGTVTVYQIKQLEQQNERLKDALLKLRDLYANEKQEQQRMQKELDNKNSEIVELNRTKENLNLLVIDYEKQIGELKEQVDNAIGSDELIELLTERNLALEDKVNELIILVEDLEHLQDVNDQIQETAKETEIELREELDMCNTKIIEYQTQLETMEETIIDYEQIIQKFRDQTEQLRETNSELQKKLQKRYDIDVTSIPVESFNFKFKYAETKSFAKTIERELSQIEVQDATQHVNYLYLFMPDHFLKSGSDRDAILILLLFPRIIRKIEIFISHIQEKFSLPENISTDDIFNAQQIDQLSFAYRFMYWLYFLQSLLHQYVSTLNNCKVEIFSKVVNVYIEMAVQEKAVDCYINLLKNDKLDENTNIESLTKSVMYFHNFYRIHLASEKFDCSILLDDHMKLMDAASKSIHIDIFAVKTFLDNDGQKSDFGLLLTDICTYSNDIRRLAKAIRRHIPAENDTSVLQFEMELKEELNECRENINKVMSVAFNLKNTAGTQQTESADVPYINVKKLKVHAQKFISELYSNYNINFDCMLKSLNIIISCMKQIANNMRQGEYETEKCCVKTNDPPILYRAKAFKEEARNHVILKAKLESRESDICDLRKILKIKKDELSEMNVRKEMAEKKLEIALKEAEKRVDKIQKQLDEANILLKEKEREFEETLDHLQADIDALEKEKLELKDKLKIVTNKDSAGIFEDLHKSTIGNNSASSDIVVAKKFSFISQQVQDLQIALQNLRNENSRLKTDRMVRQLENLPPLKIPLKPIGISNTIHLKNMYFEQGKSDVFERINTLSKECNNLMQSAHRIILPTVVDITQRKPGIDPIIDKMAPKAQLVNSAIKLKNLQHESEKLASEIAKLRASNKQATKVKSDFSSFHLPCYIKPCKEENELIARVTFPKHSNTETKTVPLLVTVDELKELHAKILP